MKKEIKEKIIEILNDCKCEGVLETWADQILTLFEEEKKKWVEDLKCGKICTNCGGKKEGELTDLCDKCLEEA